jgi:hypothetical protein
MGTESDPKRKHNNLERSRGHDLPYFRPSAVRTACKGAPHSTVSITAPKTRFIDACLFASGHRGSMVDTAEPVCYQNGDVSYLDINGLALQYLGNSVAEVVPSFAADLSVSPW